MSDNRQEFPARRGRTSWTPEEHLRRYRKNFNDGMAVYIANNLEPKSVLEFGCGLGLYCDYLKRRLGLDHVFGIEPEPMGGVFDVPDGPTQLAIDIFEDQLPQELDRLFDLVLSIEVAEHVPRDRHEFLFDFLVSRAANWIVFSGARVGQGGDGHIAERPEQEWREEFLKRGLSFKRKMTHEIRAASNERNINHRKNVMIFRKW